MLNQIQHTSKQASTCFVRTLVGSDNALSRLLYRLDIRSPLSFRGYNSINKVRSRLKVRGAFQFRRPKSLLQAGGTCTSFSRNELYWRGYGTRVDGFSVSFPPRSRLRPGFCRAPVLPLAAVFCVSSSREASAFCDLGSEVCETVIQ